MIDEDEFATVGVGLFQRGELAGFGPEDFVVGLLVLGSSFLTGSLRMNDQRTTQRQQPETNQPP
ncbi:MAG: hypothetical protein EBS84_12915 [Proteobacteria bacterium]|nr:hypothetical protein [Pseudomonadota bacterium]